MIRLWRFSQFIKKDHIFGKADVIEIQKIAAISIYNQSKLIFAYYKMTG
jgi:hypothetical protein